MLFDFCFDFGFGFCLHVGLVMKRLLWMLRPCWFLNTRLQTGHVTVVCLFLLILLVVWDVVLAVYRFSQPSRIVLK